MTTSLLSPWFVDASSTAGVEKECLVASWNDGVDVSTASWSIRCGRRGDVSVGSGLNRLWAEIVCSMAWQRTIAARGNTRDQSILSAEYTGKFALAYASRGLLGDYCMVVVPKQYNTQYTLNNTGELAYSRER